MEKHGIETLKITIEDVITVVEDIDEALEDGKLSLIEGATIVLKDGGKAIRIVKVIKDIKDEVVDLDDVEAAEIFDEVSAHFGGSEQSKVAIRHIVEGAAKMSQGIQSLIELKKGGV